MDASTWWLYNTSAGRRTLDRVAPASAIPRETREQICAEQGHVYLGDGSCRRCGHEATRPARGGGRVCSTCGCSAVTTTGGRWICGGSCPN